MRNLGFDGEPSAEVLSRLENINNRAVLVNIPELKKYLRERLREEKVSLYRLSDATKISRAQLSNALNKGDSIAFERLEMILWIVDGGTEKWNEYKRANDL